MFASVDYSTNKAFREFYNSQTGNRQSGSTALTGTNPPLSTSAQLIISGYIPSAMCGICGEIYNLYLIFDYFEDYQRYLFRNGLDSKISSIIDLTCQLTSLFLTIFQRILARPSSIKWDHLTQSEVLLK